MRFTLITPCFDCPFRSDVRPTIDAHRAEELLDELLIIQTTIVCFHTLEVIDIEHRRDPIETVLVMTDQSEACAGALIMKELMCAPHALTDMLQSVAAYDPRRLDLTAPVYCDDQEMVHVHREFDRRTRASHHEKK